MNIIILAVLPYLTIAVFVAGMVFRIYSWWKTPQPGALTLFPAPKGSTATFFGVLKESLFFPSLFKGDKALWVFAWVFHATLALIAIGHVRVFTDFPRLWATLGINADRMSAVSGGIAGVIITVAVILLLFRRISIGRVREISGLPDYLALVLILAILVTGNAMRFGEHFDLTLTHTYFSQLVTFSLSTAALPSNPMFVIHFFLAQLLIMFIPFSKIMHFGGIFFTQTLIQRA
ncbi:MAG: respiratory nitrate reductase subunit gamma [Candidatus Zixiibacteriota bacterium]|nr:MAG: respiratory nitrate reductase subunit gamma [candidate division Zixibacteria bacterium]